ncbi:MAG: DUF2252 family protein [Gaiella sp.]|uniref:DUF2252 family protein n=1 Tax=Gaiella sp. TaxID=2663207 RepID=UPI003C751577
MTGENRRAKREPPRSFRRASPTGLEVGQNATHTARGGRYGPIATAPPNSPRPGVGPATGGLYHVEEASDDERRIVRARLSGRGRMLGWERVVAIDGEKKDFYIRQLWDEKGSAELELMDDTALAAYRRICGWTLARAHARSGDRIAIAAYLGSSASFDRATAAFAESYADQNHRDYRALQEAVASGRVKAATGI